MSGKKTSSGRALRAGTARADITADIQASRIHDRLYAKALVLEDGRNRAAIVCMDTTAVGGRKISAGLREDISEDFLPELRAKIQDELGIPGSSVLVNASHTHPPGRILCAEEHQVPRVFDAVRRAAESLTEVKAGSGEGYEDRIIINRTLRLRGGRHWTVRKAYPCPPDEEVSSLGPVDPGIGILRIDRMDGTPLAALYNYGCHPLAGIPGNRISAYLPGFASGVIEETLGCGATALFMQGAGGDIIDILFKNADRPRDTGHLGMMLGLSTLKAFRGIKTRRGAALGAVSEKIRLPRRKDFPERIKILEKQQEKLLDSLRFTSLNLKAFIPLYIKYALSPEYPSDYSFRYMHSESRGSDEFRLLDEENRANIAKYLDNVRAMEELSKIRDDIDALRRQEKLAAASGEETITAEIQGIRIGDCAVITLPAELPAEVGLNIKKASTFKQTLVASCSNGYMHYGPPASSYGRGGYEAAESPLAPEWQDIFEKKAAEIMAALGSG